MIPLRMVAPLRRLVALLTLASAGLAQSAMIGCPTALAKPMANDVATQATPHGEHAHHMASGNDDRQASEVEGGSTAPFESSCTMPVGCGVTGITSPRWTGASAAAPTLEARRLIIVARYTTVFPAHEPPPPRFLV
jgi:hypothetical protein